MNHVARTRPPLDQVQISVVLPLYNEQRVLRRLRNAIFAALEPCGCRVEIIFVNDGSSDGGDQILDAMAAADDRVRVLHLSRNFGHQAAVQAGLAHATGDAVIVMDADLQDDPACLPRFIEKWQAGYDVVYAQRTGRKENWIKRLLFFAFYRVLNAVSTTPIPNDAGNFSLIDRSAVRHVASLTECDRYLPGLRTWVGFRQTGIPVERGARHDDRPRVSMLGLFKLAKTAIISFSRVPLSLFYTIAVVSVLVCMGCTAFTLYHRLLTDLAIPGWTSITIVASFFGAINALGIGVLGEYVVRIYDQVRARPQFIVARSVNFNQANECVDFEERLLETIDQLAVESSLSRPVTRHEPCQPNSV